MITRTRVEMVESFRDLIALIRSIFNFFFFLFRDKTVGWMGFYGGLFFFFFLIHESEMKIEIRHRILNYRMDDFSIN